MPRSSARCMPTIQASMLVWPLGPSGNFLKKARPKLRPAHVFCPTSGMPYFAETEGTLITAWHLMGQLVQPDPRTVYCHAMSPRKNAALFVRYAILFRLWGSHVPVATGRGAAPHTRPFPPFQRVLGL